MSSRCPSLPLPTGRWHGRTAAYWRACPMGWAFAPFGVLRVSGHDVDARVSTLPVQQGQWVVMRLLDRLGMSMGDAETFANLLMRPDGMLPVAGPTGSGTTTSLNVALEALNPSGVDIITVDDPIDDALEGIGQTRANPRPELTFARGLSAILLSAGTHAGETSRAAAVPQLSQARPRDRG